MSVLLDSSLKLFNPHTEDMEVLSTSSPRTNQANHLLLILKSEVVIFIASHPLTLYGSGNNTEGNCHIMSPWSVHIPELIVHYICSGFIDYMAMY